MVCDKCGSFETPSEKLFGCGAPATQTSSTIKLSHDICVLGYLDNRNGFSSQLSGDSQSPDKTASRIASKW